MTNIGFQRPGIDRCRTQLRPHELASRFGRLLSAMANDGLRRFRDTRPGIASLEYSLDSRTSRTILWAAERPRVRNGSARTALAHGYGRNKLKPCANHLCKFLLANEVCRSCGWQHLPRGLWIISSGRVHFPQADSLVFAAHSQPYWRCLHRPERNSMHAVSVKLQHGKRFRRFGRMHTDAEHTDQS